MTTYEILRKAADVIRERGWHQGDYEGPGGGVCAEGAINVVCNGTPNESGETAHKARVVLASFLNNIINSWNDAPDRTVDEVIAALEEAAKRAEISA